MKILTNKGYHLIVKLCMSFWVLWHYLLFFSFNYCETYVYSINLIFFYVYKIKNTTL